MGDHTVHDIVAGAHTDLGRIHLINSNNYRCCGQQRQAQNITHTHTQDEVVLCELGMTHFVVQRVSLVQIDIALCKHPIKNQ